MTKPPYSINHTFMPWRHELTHAYESITDLLKNQLIHPDDAARLSGLERQFKTRITPYYASLFGPPNEHCPIRLQAIPALTEADPLLPDWAMAASQRIYGRPSPWHPDAIGDLKNLAAPRLTHRYGNRAILHLTSSCSVYCRFCFRKSHLNDQDRPLYEGSLDAAFDYLGHHPEIRELILTGGDPLMLADPAFEKLLERCETISSLRVLRIHSRTPVTLPARFTGDLISILAKRRAFRIHLVAHFNHPKELSPLAHEKIQGLLSEGITIFNQSVLLRDVNDDAMVLTSLFQSLYETGVVPLYLHHPDWTPGTFAFRVSIEDGRSIFAKLRGRLSGPALPDYVLDIPQGLGKVSLMGDSVQLGEKLNSNQDTHEIHPPLGGAIYQVTPPTIREELLTGSLPVSYLDLFPIKKRTVR